MPRTKRYKRAYSRNVSTSRGTKRVYSTDRGVLKRLRTGGAFSTGASYKRNSCKGELKYKDIALNKSVPTAASVPPDYELLPIITQGSGDGQRDGREIRLKKIEWNIYWYDSAARAATTTSASAILRFNLFLDTQCNGQLIANALKDDQIMIGAMENSLPNPLLADRIRMLKTKFKVLPGQPVSLGTGGAFVGVSRTYSDRGSYTFSGDGRKIIYQGTTGTSGADLPTDNIYISTKSTSTNISYTGSVRLWYYA